MRHKEILLENIRMFNIIKQILNNLKNGIEFKIAYLTLLPDFEKSKEEMVLNRFKIK